MPKSLLSSMAHFVAQDIALHLKDELGSHLPATRKGPPARRGFKTSSGEKRLQASFPSHGNTMFTFYSFEFRFVNRLGFRNCL
eukprot:476553-Rhodomonas_salina.1